jgi:hypothetical protein
MDLNDFIFRDDTVLALGADPETGDDSTEEGAGSATLVKVGFAAAVGGAVLGLSSFLGHAAKGL